MILITGVFLTGTAEARTPDYWHAGQDLSLEADPEYQRFFNRGAADWIVAREHGDTVYFLFSFPTIIQRYDMATESWLTDIALPSGPTALAVDADGLYVAFGDDLKRYALDGTGETDLATTPFPVEEMHVDGGLLLIKDADDLASIDKATGAVLDNRDYFYRMTGLAIAPAANKIYARSTGVSPSDIVEMTYDASGTLGSQNDSSFHGDYPSAVATFVAPDESAVADNSGVVYTGSLGYAGSLAGPFDDIAFYAGGSVVLRASTLYGHDTSFLEFGRGEFANAVSRVFVNGDTVFGFYSDATGAAVETILLADLVPPDPGAAVDPTGTVYTPDQVVRGTEGVIYLLHRSLRQIYRWSTESRTYLESIPLAEEPQGIAFSMENAELYLSYASGRLTRVSGGAQPASLLEQSWVNSPQTPCGLATAGEFIFVCDPSGAWVSHFTYDSAGGLVSQEEWNYFSEEYVWSAANRKMYHLRDGTSPNDLLWEEIAETGVIGQQMDSPLHSSTGMQHPIRVHPEGSIVLLGSGRFHDAQSLVLLEELGTSFVDAAWFGGKLVTMHADADNSELRTWNAFLAAVESTQPLAGNPLRLIDLGAGPAQLLAITQVGGVPTFSLIDTPLFVDGFESGDTSGWSETIP